MSGTLFGMREAGLTLDELPGSEAAAAAAADRLADGYVAGRPRHPHPHPRA